MLHIRRKTQKVISLAVFFMVPWITQQAYADTCRVVHIASNDVLNMREGASTRTPIVDMLTPDQTGIKSSFCKKVGKSRWCYVTNPETQIQGWASKNFLRCSKQNSTQYNYSYSTCRVVGIRNNDVLNIRRGASTKTPIVGMLAPHQTNISSFECKRVGKKSRWCYVSDPNSLAEGWVSAKYLSCR